MSRWHKICRLTAHTYHAHSFQVGEYTVHGIPCSFFSKLGYICLILCSCHKFWASVSSLYRMYCRASVPEQGGIPQQGLKLLTCQRAGGMLALYWSPVISGCVIRNSAELPYLEEEERRPWGKLRLWQEFIIAFHPIYIDFVPICTRPPREENTAVDMMFTCPPDSLVPWGQKRSSDVVLLRRLVELKSNKDGQRNGSGCLEFWCRLRGN